MSVLTSLVERTRALLIPRDQCNFFDYQSRNDHKVEVKAQLRTLFNNKERVLSWKYDDKALRTSIRSGDHQLSYPEVYSNFLEWSSTVNIIHLINQRTGEVVKCMAPKRGNIAYANKQSRKVRALSNLFQSFYQFKPQFPGRDRYYLTNTLLLTVTYDHAKCTAQEAWANQTRYINATKTKLKRLYPGNQLLFVVSPEGTSSDYPSPHIIILNLDGFFHVEKHVSLFKKHKGKVTYRIPRGDFQERFRSKWPYGTVDIQGIADGKVTDMDSGKSEDPLYYVSKYACKSLHLESDKPIDIEHDVALHTLANQKLFGSRIVISSKLKRSLSERVVRLDTDFYKSQHLDSSSSSEKGNWAYHKHETCKLEQYIRKITAKPPPLNPRFWGRGHVTLDLTHYAPKLEPAKSTGINWRNVGMVSK